MVGKQLGFSDYELTTAKKQTKREKFLSEMEVVVSWQAGSSWEYASVSTITPHSNAPEGWRFTSRQPISSVATTSAGRA